MIRPLRLPLSIISMAFAASPLFAASLGEIQLYSRIGEPLRAEVPITAGKNETIDTACFTLGSSKEGDFPVISKARLKLLRDDAGFRLQIQGSAPVSDPIFMLIVRAGCGFEIQREFVLMPNAPSELTAANTAAREMPVPAKEFPPLGSEHTSESFDEKAVSPAPKASGARKTPPPQKTSEKPESRRPVAAAPAPIPAPTAAPARKPAATAASETHYEKPLATGKPGDKLLLGSAPEDIQPANRAVKSPSQDVQSRIQKLEETLQLLNAEIETLDKALEITTKTIAAQKSLQQAQAVLQAQSQIPPPAASAPSNSGNWLEIILSALLGGGIAAGVALFLGKKRESRLDEQLPLNASLRHQGWSTQPEPQAPVVPAAIPSIPAAPPIPEPPAPEEVPPIQPNMRGDQIKPSFIEMNDDDSALELAEIMLSFGRLKGAEETLVEHIETKSPRSFRPWLMLLELYRRSESRSNFETLSEKIRQRFNVDLPDWDSLGETILGPTSIETYAHIMWQLEETWGTQAGMDYLCHLSKDNRSGKRKGFPPEIAEEIDMMIRILEQAYGLKRND